MNSPVDRTSVRINFLIVITLLVILSTFVEGGYTGVQQSYVKVGDVGLIDCTYTPDAGSTVIWMLWDKYECGGWYISKEIYLYAPDYQTLSGPRSPYTTSQLNVTSQSPQVLMILNTQLTNASVYQCSPYQTVGYSAPQHDILLSVAELPVISASTPVKSTADATFTCGVTYNIAYNLTGETVRWRLGNDVIETGVTGSTSNPSTCRYTGSYPRTVTSKMKTATKTLIKKFSANDHGRNLTCELTQPNGNIWVVTSIQLDVLFEPQQVSINTNSALSNIIEGDDVVLVCEDTGSTPANPTVDAYTWRVNGSSLAETSQRLTLNNIRRGQSGTYACTAGSVVGSTASTGVDIDVKYKPSQVVIITSVNNANIEEGDDVFLACSYGSANPVVNRYEWSVDGIPLSYTARTLTLKNIRRSQTGRYMCVAVNGVGASSSESKGIVVRYSATLHQKPTDQEVKKVGDNVTFTISVSAEPMPTRYAWYTANSTIAEQTGRYHIIRNGFSSSLSILNIQQPDFTNYMCQVDNSVKTPSTFIFTLKQQGPPSKPTELTVVNRSLDYITLSWTAGFNGGLDQTFAVDYRISHKVSWNTDKGIPDVGHVEIVHTVRGLESSTKYEFRVKASNGFNGGSDSEYSDVVAQTYVDGGLPAKAIVGIVISLILVMVCAVGVSVWCYKRMLSKSKHYEPRDTTTEPDNEYATCSLPQQDGTRMNNESFELENYLSPDIDVVYEEIAVSKMRSDSQTDQMAIGRHKLTLDGDSIEGTFGRLFKGTLMVTPGGEMQNVSVRIQKDESTHDTKQQILDDISLMATMERNNNVVAMIGCCTETEPVYQVLEFLPHGNLYNYLTAFRDASVDQQLTSYNLINFGLQIAAGIMFLHSKKIIHGDIAARNVFLSDSVECKVSLFAVNGQSKNQSESKALENLSIRWMSPECIAKGTYTTSSDVWSYGVLLWEIMTFARTPYEGMQTELVLDHVNNGGRPRKPDDCGSEIYSLMMSCWSECPEFRPAFKRIYNLLENLVHDV